jgi:molybdenum cofactor biosynthesis enzyme MoaA
MRLEKIGFYTLFNKRAKELNYASTLQRCEILLNNVCNFDCIYCRDKKADYVLDIDMAKYYIDLCHDEMLKNIRFSGGEPTLYKGLDELIKYANDNFFIKNIALSTNGSADLSFYKYLVKRGITDLSISLDSCCSDIANKMAGENIDFDKICNNIKELSKICYVTI